MKQTTIRLDEELLKKIKFICLKKGVSLNQVANQLFSEWVKENEKEEEKDGEK